jgi:hypothetical protein
MKEFGSYILKYMVTGSIHAGTFTWIKSILNPLDVRHFMIYKTADRELSLFFYRLFSGSLK